MIQREEEVYVLSDKGGMGDRKSILFPSLLFALFFVLIAITGFIQIRIVQKNFETLLKSEGETLISRIIREIDTNLEYLNYVEQSPAIITPKFLNIMAYDESIVEELFDLISTLSDKGTQKVPFKNILILNDNGTVLMKKGVPTIPSSYVSTLVSRKQKTVIKMPEGKDKSLIMGATLNGRIVFISLDEEELALFRKKLIVQEILEKEEKGIHITGITVYNQSGEVFANLAVNGNKENNLLSISKTMGSRFLPDYTIKVSISKKPSHEAVRRTTLSFFSILVFVVLLGGIGIYGIFLLQKHYETKMKEMERNIALKERLVSLGKLASGVAHEIRNPLNAISLSVQRLKREFLPEKEKREEYYNFLDIVKGELTRVNRIVEDFLHSTKAQEPYHKTNLYTLLDEVVVLLKEKAKSRNVEILNTVEHHITIDCQTERLKQAFHNIILNGIEAIQTKGSIKILAEEHNNIVYIYIQDSGVGIKEKELPNIFEYYYTTKDKGIGLGLPISYMIVRDHGGDITVKSKEGHGTTFIISLPVIHEGMLQ